MYLSTKQVADLFGLHANTIRKYEEQGYISKVMRRQNSYRQFSKDNINEIEFVRMVIPGPYPVSSKLIIDMLKEHVKKDYKGCLEYANKYLELTLTEQKQSIKALDIMDEWLKDNLSETEIIIAESRNEMAKICDITVDTLRTWERNGLHINKRHKNNRIYYTKNDSNKIMVIRLLRKAGFSINIIRQTLYHYDNMKPSYFIKEVYNKDSICKTNDWLEYLEEHIIRANRLIEVLNKKITLHYNTTLF